MGQGHVGMEVKKALQDLIAVVENLETLQANNTGANADKRYLQAKLHEAISQRRQAEKDLQAMKSAISQDLPPIIKDISVEIHYISQQGQVLQNPALQNSADRVRQQLRLLVETLTSTGSKS